MNLGLFLVECMNITAILHLLTKQHLLSRCPILVVAPIVFNPGITLSAAFYFPLFKGLSFLFISVQNIIIHVLWLQLRKMLDLLVHASQCRSPHCQYPNCRKVKGLFRHGIQCRIRASGGCVLCKKMWYLLQLHARACKESECHVPRCRFVSKLFVSLKEF